MLQLNVSNIRNAAVEDSVGILYYSVYCIVIVIDIRIIEVYFVKALF